MRKIITPAKQNDITRGDQGDEFVGEQYSTPLKRIR